MAQTVPMQNMMLTMATDGMSGRRVFDLTVKYPFVCESLDFPKGEVPHDVLVALGDTSLSFDECQALFDDLRSRLRELGVKMTDEIDIRYCQIISEGGATKAEYILVYEMK